MSTYLLDANTISLLIRTDPAVDRKVRTADRQGDALILSPLVEYEIRRGLIRKGATRAIELFEALKGGFIYQPFDDDTWTTGARLWAEAHRDGRPLPDADILIAAQALQQNAVLVTANLRHFTYFERFGLKIENWKQ